MYELPKKHYVGLFLPKKRSYLVDAELSTTDMVEPGKLKLESLQIALMFLKAVEAREEMREMAREKMSASLLKQSMRTFPFKPMGDPLPLWSHKDMLATINTGV